MRSWRLARGKAWHMKKAPTITKGDRRKSWEGRYCAASKRGISARHHQPINRKEEAEMGQKVLMRASWSVDYWANPDDYVGCAETPEQMAQVDAQADPFLILDRDGAKFTVEVLATFHK